MSPKFWNIMLGITILIIIGLIIFVALYRYDARKNPMGKWRGPVWTQKNINEYVYFQSNIQGEKLDSTTNKVPYKCHVLKNYGVNQLGSSLKGENTLYVVCRDKRNQIKGDDDTRVNDLVYTIPAHIKIDAIGTAKQIVPHDNPGISSYDDNGNIIEWKNRANKLPTDLEPSCYMLDYQDPDSGKTNPNFKLVSGYIYPTMACKKELLVDSKKNQPEKEGQA